MSLVGQAGSACQAFEVIGETEPDVVVVDISLKDAHGLSLVQNLRAYYPELKVVILSMYDEKVYAERAIRAGAQGYVMKSTSTDEIVKAIQYASRGEIYLSRKMSLQLLSKVAAGETSSEPGFATDELTDREMEVFQMLGEGCSVNEICERLNISRKPVETYRRRAKEKLDLESVTCGFAPATGGPACLLTVTGFCQHTSP